MSEPVRASPPEALRPSPVTRVSVTVVLGGFVAGTLVALGRGTPSGAVGWVALVAACLVSLTCVVGLVAVWTQRVWVDPVANEVHQTVVFRDVIRPLDPPGTVELRHTPATLATAAPTWKVVFHQPGLVGMGVSTPWVSDIGDLLRLLQPALARNPDLPADERTRAAIRDPDAVLTRVRRGGSR